MLIETARAWAAMDPDPKTRAQLEAMIADPAQHDELDDCFRTRLEFGTAGLRGALGPGPNRMNRVVVMQAAAGLAAWLNQRGGGAVVIGYDARHNSDVFAHDTAAVLTGAGISAMVLPEALPTPVLAFAIRYLGCAAGVMVTASHNPPQDNGYKVYVADGSQIVPPTDHEIAAEIERIAATIPVTDLPLGDEWDTLGPDVEQEYVRTAAMLVPATAPRDLRVVYTAMHGVGARVLTSVFAEAGFDVPIPVLDQIDPDPDFPTVAFPNPEEPGAIDRALETARAQNADVVIANDPDADRCAMAVPDRHANWRMLRGDEVGALLAWWMVQRSPGTKDQVFAQSIVSCSLLKAIAESNGFGYQQTLTGFKWIGRIPGLAYGYEEALGYCVDPAHVKDKDGITAALLLVEMAAALKTQQRTVHDVLDELARTYGLYATDQVSVRVNDLSRIGQVMSALRATPPSLIGGFPVTRFVDLESPESDLPPTDGLLFELEGQGRVIVRPSGTEPKVKCYLQTVVPVDSTADSLERAHQRARSNLEQIATDVRTWLA